MDDRQHVYTHTHAYGRHHPPPSPLLTYIQRQRVRRRRHVGVAGRLPLAVGGLPLRIERVEGAEEEARELESHLVLVCVSMWGGLWLVGSVDW